MTRILLLFILCLEPPVSLTESDPTSIAVCSSNGDNCSGVFDINQALERVTTDTVLLLEPGRHVVSTFVLLHNLTGVAITGKHHEPSEVIVQCNDNTGLAFFGVESLSLSNFTLDGCGISNENLNKVVNFVYVFFEEELFQFPSGLNIALFIGNSQDVLIRNLHIQNTTGIGLMAINIDGELVDNVFEDNHSESKELPSIIFELFNRDHVEFIGGAAYVLYLDHNRSSDFNNSYPSHCSLLVSNCLFVNNFDLSSIGSVELFYLYSRVARLRGYPLGGSGGLTVMLTQLHFSVNVEVVSSQFERNVARFGGGAHVSLFSGVTDSSVVFSDCQFVQNGLHENTFIVGGLSIFLEVSRPQQIENEFVFPPFDTRNISILITNTKFIGNTAFTTGAVSVISLYVPEIADSTLSVKFQHCVFEQNVATRASALSIFEQKYIGLNEGVQVTLEDCTFVNNSISTSGTSSEGGDYGSVVSAQSVNFTFVGHNEFLSNLGTALAGVRSLFYIFGGVVFRSNIGINGGALRLNSLSFLVLQPNSTVSFVKNSAVDKGGAISASIIGDEYYVLDDECFLHLGNVEYNSQSETGLLDNLNITVTFQGNRALTGSVIFGATLESCPWTASIPIVDTNYTVFQNMYHNSENRFFIFDEEPVGMEQISGFSERIQVDTSMYRPVMPGEQFRIPIEAFDKFQQSIPEGISMAVLLPDQTLDVLGSRLGESGFWFLDGTPTGLNTPITLLGMENQTLNAFISSITQGSSANVNVLFSLTQCLVGFLYNKTSRSCYCDPRLSEFDIECDISTRSLTVPDRVWFGPFEAGNDSMETLVLGSCPINFCKLGPKVVTDDDFEFQCADDSGRTDILCGGCKEGLSITLGRSQCIKCSNYNLFFLILLAFVGILIVASLATLHISVAEGYLNNVLFYSNVLSFNSFLLLPFEPVRNYLFSIAGSLSLILNIGICLFDGMTAFWLVLMNYGFVVYFLLLLVLVILIAKFVSLPGQRSYSPVKILATLLLLSYVALAELSLLSLSFVTIRSLDDLTYVRWFLDPTEPYFQGRHIALGIIAIVVLFGYVIPLPLLVLFPNFVYNSKYLIRLKPLLDAIWAPFKTKHRWWLGFRLLARIVIIFMSAYISVPHSLFALGIFLTLILLLQQAVSPFQKYWCNLLDSYFMTNLILLVIGALYFRTTRDEQSHIIFTSIIVSLAYLVFLVVLIVHIYIRFPDKFDRAKNWFQLKLLSCINSKKTEQNTDQNPSDEKEQSLYDSAAPHPKNQWQQDKTLPGYTSPKSPHIVSFTEFREPLLDDSGEVEVNTTVLASRVLSASMEMLNIPNKKDRVTKERRNDVASLETTV